MELNQTPVRTSKNYGINSIKVSSKFIEDDLINNTKNVLKIKNYDNFCIINNNDIIIDKIVDTKIENYLSEYHKNQLKNDANLKLNIRFVKSSDEPTILSFDLSNQSNILVDTININIEKKIESKIIIKYYSKDLVSAYHNQLLKINLAEDSKLDIIIVYDLSQSSENYVSIESNLKENSNLTITTIDFACENSIINYNSIVAGENANSNINSLYVGDNNATIDLNYLSQLFAPNSKTNIEVIGTLSGNARKNFKGTIDFKKGCKKSFGNENEFCLLLSKTAKSKALPMLLCTEEDVDGRHSASVGKVDEKQLFYIMSRGVPYEDAVKLIVKAKFNGVINQIFDENLKIEILNKIDGKRND